MEDLNQSCFPIIFNCQTVSQLGLLRRAAESRAVTEEARGSCFLSAAWEGPLCSRSRSRTHLQSPKGESGGACLLPAVVRPATAPFPCPRPGDPRSPVGRGWPLGSPGDPQRGEKHAATPGRPARFRPRVRVPFVTTKCLRHGQPHPGQPVPSAKRVADPGPRPGPETGTA